jgi:hypothetical protein
MASVDTPERELCRLLQLASSGAEGTRAPDLQSVRRTLGRPSESGLAVDFAACGDSNVPSNRAAPVSRPITFPSFRRQNIRCERGLDFCGRTKNRRQPLDAGVCFRCHRGADKRHRKISRRRRHWSSQFATAATLKSPQSTRRRRLRRPRNSKRPSESRPARFTMARNRWTSRDT